MLDYSKVTYNEIDDTDEPLQVFFNYEVAQADIEKIVEAYATDDEVPKGMYLCGMELCLCVYSINDFKLEAVCSNDNAEQFWFEINNQFRDADILLSKIPPDILNKIRDMFGVNK